MGKAFSITWHGIVDTYNELFPMVGMNLIWLAASIVPVFILFPLAYVAFEGGVTPEASTSGGLLSGLLVALIVVFSPNPGYIGVHYYVSHILNEMPTEFAVVWEGFRKYWKKGLALFAISVVVYVVLIGNIAFYLSNESLILKMIGVIMIYVFVLIWLPMQMYIMPLMMEQENKSIRRILRNSALLAMDNVVVTLTLLIICLAMLVLSLTVTILITLLSASLLAAIQHRATMTLLEKYKARGANLGR